MIVRPSFIEAAVHRQSTSSVVQHLLINYQRAHVAIIKAQFTCKRLRDGMTVRPPMASAYTASAVFSAKLAFLLPIAVILEKLPTEPCVVSQMVRPK